METDGCYASSDLRKWCMFSALDAEFLSNIKLAYIFGKRGTSALMVTRDDQVFAMGSNEFCCLALGKEPIVSTPTKIRPLCNRRVRGFVSGSGGHVMAYTETGQVYFWGYSGWPIIGGDYNMCFVTPMSVFPEICGSEVVDIACGCAHVLSLTKDGEVYAFGGFRGMYEAMMNKQSDKAIAIACGEDSAFFVTENGKLYAWGFNESCQLGVLGPGFQPYPREVTMLSNVVVRKVVCGRAHAMALTDAGILYTWGDNTYGQLGIYGVQLSVPVSVTLGPHRVVDIAATHYSNMSAAMTENWKVYIWGECGAQLFVKPFKTSFTSLYDAFAMYSTPRVTWKPIEVDCNAEESIADSWRQAFDDPSLSDLVIQVKGEPIHVHKTLLKMRCEHFRSMFQEHWKEEHENLIKIDQFSYTTYRAFLQYLYTDELKIAIEDAIEMLDLAESYFEMSLKMKCQDIIRNGVTVENVTLLYSTSLNYEMKDLQCTLLKFCRDHVKDVVKTESFKALGAQTRLDFLCKAVESVSLDK